MTRSQGASLDLMNPSLRKVVDTASVYGSTGPHARAGPDSQSRSSGLQCSASHAVTRCCFFSDWPFSRGLEPGSKSPHAILRDSTPSPHNGAMSSSRLG